MSRDNSVNITAGGNVNVEALAVGDGARAAAINAPVAGEIAQQFLLVRAAIDELEAKGALTAPQAKLLRDETVDVEASANKAVEDEAEKPTVEAKLARLAAGVQAFCGEQRHVFGALASIASVLMVRLPLPFGP